MQIDPASVIARLIDKGEARVPTDQLPLEWRAAYDAARWARGGRYHRLNAFNEALNDQPNATDFYQKYLAASLYHPTDTRLSQQRIYSAWEVLADPPPSPGWGLAGLFGGSSLNLLVGNPGAKKTWLALDLAVCIAAGLDWLGRPCTPTPVLLVDEESGPTSLLYRLHQVIVGHGQTIHLPIHFMSMGGFNFSEHSEVEVLLDTARSFKAGFILIDSLTLALGGVDENNVLSLRPAFGNLRWLAQECEATVLAVHHTNKKGVYRGSTFIASGVDHMLYIESGMYETALNLRTIKSRDLDPISITAQANFLPDRFFLSTSDQGPDLKLSPAAWGILRQLAQSETVDTHQLIKHNSTVTAGYIRSLIQELVASGFISRANPGDRGSKACYGLTPAGAAILKGG